MKRQSAAGASSTDTDLTVGQIARRIEPLKPDDAIARAIEAMRSSGLTSYPVVSGGRLLRIVSLGEIKRFLDGAASVSEARLEPLTAMNTADSRDLIVASSSARLEEASALLDEAGDTSILPVLDDQGRYCCVLAEVDLIAARARTLCPPRMGGMATPLGVYLTDGVYAGGAGVAGLMLTGVCLGLLSVIAALATDRLQDALLRHPAVDPFLAVQNWAARRNIAGSLALVDDLRSYTTLLVMLVLLRLIPLAGYHAAEHQVVHCTERGQPLTLPMVRSMPRVHPRCGTNLVAALTLFGLALAVMSLVAGSSSNAIVPAALVTVALWRPFGSFLQKHFTTRKASDKQILNGISAAEMLLVNYRGGVSRKGNPMLRIWRMGLFQVIAGYAVVLLALYLIGSLLPGSGIKFLLN